VGFGVTKELATIDVRGYNMARSLKFGNVTANGPARFVLDLWRGAPDADDRPVASADS
jgi:hypothetical protein